MSDVSKDVFTNYTKYSREELVLEAFNRYLDLQSIAAKSGLFANRDVVEVTVSDVAETEQPKRRRTKTPKKRKKLGG